MQYNMVTKQLAICCTLLKRDIWLLRKRTINNVIDITVTTTMQLLVIGHLFPLLGMPLEHRLSLFIGLTTTSFLFTLGFSRAMSIVYNVPHAGYAAFEYYMTLPIHKKYIFLYYILSFVIETLLITLLPLLIGLFFLGFTILSIKILWFILFYIVALFAVGTFFLSISFAYDPLWFRDNIWPRRLSPLFCFSASFYAWKLVAQTSPVMGMILLANPFTYIAEGIRQTLEPNVVSLPLWLCIIGVMVFIGISMWILYYGVHKQLDPV